MRIALILIALLLVPVLAGSSADSAGPTLSSDDMSRLQGGEILVQTIHGEKSGGAARVTALFDAVPDQVWDVLGYCENEFVYVRGLELCEVLEPGLFLITKHHRVNNNWYTPTIDFTFEASRTSPTRGEFKLLGGDLKVMEGLWDFEPLPGGDGLIVTHEIRIRSKFPAPRWLVRRVLKGDLPDMLACVRGLAKASLDDEQYGNDLGRCPGDTGHVEK